MEIYHIETNGKIKKDVRISAIGDIHIDENTKYLTIASTILQITKTNPDYIFILGDILNNSDVDKNTLDVVDYFLNMLSRKAPVYIIYGNHDKMAKFDGKWEAYQNSEYAKLLSCIPNLTLLDNNSITLPESISLTGVTLPYSYYEVDLEDRKIYLKLLSQYIESGLLSKIDLDCYKILLQHSPNNLFDNHTYLELLKIIRESLGTDVNFDMVLSAHEHNGLVPPYIAKILPGNRGFVGLLGNQKRLFKSNCRGIKQLTTATTGIILPPVTTFADNLRSLNIMYPPKIKVLELKK